MLRGTAFPRFYTRSSETFIYLGWLVNYTMRLVNVVATTTPQDTGAPEGAQCNSERYNE